MEPATIFNRSSSRLCKLSHDGQLPAEFFDPELIGLRGYGPGIPQKPGAFRYRMECALVANRDVEAGTRVALCSNGGSL